MNLRQKCKRLKKENDRLKDRPVVPILEIDRCDVKRIGVSRKISLFDLEMPGVLEFVKSNMAHELGESLLPYMEFDISDNFELESTKNIRAELKVAVRRD